MAADTDQQTTEDSPDKKPGMMTLVKALAFVSVIVLLEVAAASMIIPTAEETTEIAETLAEADTTQDPEAAGETAEESEDESILLSEMTEVELGMFHVLTYNPETGSRLNVDLELFGTVLADEESEFYPLFEANQRRIREQILITIRSAEVTDLSDAGLGLIKRKILEKTNRALGKPLLHEAIFSKFSFEER
ncbi:MAG: hypothetical protein CMJ72_10045 [Planctomycetaceae bacterium]|nr:hypothetical protein [Planctomycetaceae bacterium]